MGNAWSDLHGGRYQDHITLTREQYYKHRDEVQKQEDEVGSDDAVSSGRRMRGMRFPNSKGKLRSSR